MVRFEGRQREVPKAARQVVELMKEAGRKKEARYVMLGTMGIDTVVVKILCSKSWENEVKRRKRWYDLIGSHHQGMLQGRNARVREWWRATVVNENPRTQAASEKYISNPSRALCLIPLP